MRLRFGTIVAAAVCASLYAAGAYDYEVRAVLRKALVTRIVATKRVYSPKCYWPEQYDTGDVTCLFGRFEIPNDHDSVTFEVRPLNAWGKPHVCMM